MVPASSGESGCECLAANRAEIPNCRDFILLTNEPVCNTGFDRASMPYISDEWDQGRPRSLLFYIRKRLMLIAGLNYLDLDG